MPNARSPEGDQALGYLTYDFRCLAIVSDCGLISDSPYESYRDLVCLFRPVLRNLDFCSLGSVSSFFGCKRECTPLQTLQLTLCFLSQCRIDLIGNAEVNPSEPLCNDLDLANARVSAIHLDVGYRFVRLLVQNIKNVLYLLTSFAMLTLERKLNCGL